MVPTPAARRQNHRQLEFYHHVQHELLGIDGHQHAAGALHYQPVVHQAGRKVQPVEIDLDPAQRAARSGKTGGTNL